MAADASPPLRGVAAIDDASGDVVRRQAQYQVHVLKAA